MEELDRIKYLIHEVTELDAQIRDAERADTMEDAINLMRKKITETMELLAYVHGEELDFEIRL